MLLSHTVDEASLPFATLLSPSLYHLVNKAHQSETGEYLTLPGGLGNGWKVITVG